MPAPQPPNATRQDLFPVQPTPDEARARELASEERTAKFRRKAMFIEGRDQFLARIIGLSPFAYTGGVQTMLLPAYLAAGEMTTQAFQEVWRGLTFSYRRHAKSRWKEQQKIDNRLINKAAMRDARMAKADKEWRMERRNTNALLPDVSRHTETLIKGAVSALYIQAEHLDKNGAAPTKDADRVAAAFQRSYAAFGNAPGAVQKILGVDPKALFGTDGPLAKSSVAFLAFEAVVQHLQTDAGRIAPNGSGAMYGAAALGVLWKAAGVRPEDLPKDVFANSFMNDVAREGYFCKWDREAGTEYLAEAELMQRRVDRFVEAAKNQSPEPDAPGLN